MCNEYITPVIVKYPFWQMTLTNEKAVYACINYGEAFCPGEIEDRSICIDEDISKVLGVSGDGSQGVSGDGSQ